MEVIIQWNCIQNKRGPAEKILLKGVFIPKLLNNPLVSWCLINFDFLILHTVHYDKRIIHPYFNLGTFGFLFSVFFLHFKQYENTSSNCRR